MLNSIGYLYHYNILQIKLIIFMQLDLYKPINSMWAVWRHHAFGANKNNKTKQPVAYAAN